MPLALTWKSVAFDTYSMRSVSRLMTVTVTSVTTVLMPHSIIQLVTYILCVQIDSRFRLILNTEILFAAVILHRNSK